MTDFIFEIATLGGIGTPFIVPGLIAAVIGIAWFWLLYSLFDRFMWVVTLGQIFLAIGVATVAEKVTAIKDPGIIVIDEFVAIGVIFMGLKPPHSYATVFLYSCAFIIFILMDSLKPFGISYIEILPSGLGIVFDDVAAALIARGFLWVIEERNQQ